jgi:hypothetical protein
MIKKTGYSWSCELKVRILDLSKWGDEDSYFTVEISGDEFVSKLALCKVKPNSMPRKTEMYLGYRMYGFVNYQLSGTIHAGIQFGHAVVDYGQMVKGLPSIEQVYDKWANNDKTFIILSGGTTNDREDYYGGLQAKRDLLDINAILFSEFREPDLNDSLTAVVFLADERVYDKELYPDFIEEKAPYSRRTKESKKEEIQRDERNDINYQKWVEKIGGVKNAILRELLKNQRMA